MALVGKTIKISVTEAC